MEPGKEESKDFKPNIPELERICVREQGAGEEGSPNSMQGGGKEDEQSHSECSLADSTRAWRVKDSTRAWPVKDSTRAWHVKDSTQAWPVRYSTRAWPVKDSTRAWHVKDSTRAWHVKDSIRAWPVKDSTRVPIFVTITTLLYCSF
ncbi:UNVERIFIED_CONTAM: hypothetical protein FKN15_070881 [Acipenser sinensis]